MGGAIADRAAGPARKACTASRTARRAHLFRSAVAGFLLIAGGVSGCDSGHTTADSPATQASPRARVRPAVASLVPAATDLLIGMGADDHLVAVSNFDLERDGTRGLPKVGDYERTDWEQIASLRPDFLVTQYADGRTPAGMIQREQELAIRPLNVHIDSLADIDAACDALGDAVSEREGGRLEKDESGPIGGRPRVVGRSRPSVLIVRSASGLDLVGPGTFLSELLEIAGGTNAAASLKSKYPSIDREMLQSIDPDIILELLPEASTQVIDEVRCAWSTLPELKAVRNGRTPILIDWYLLQPCARGGYRRKDGRSHRPGGRHGRVAQGVVRPRRHTRGGPK